MQRKRFTSLCGCLVLLTMGIQPGIAQDTESSGAELGDEELMQAWVDFMTPGPQHERLKQRVGNWTVRIETWSGPEAASMVSQATAEAELMMGGRYLATTIEGSFQDQEFHGKSILGYDKLKEKFVSIWIDNFGTGFVISTGTYDESSQVFEYAMMSPDVESGQYKRTRHVEKMLGDDKWVTEVYDAAGGGAEFLTMRATYERATKE